MKNRPKTHGLCALPHENHCWSSDWITLHSFHTGIDGFSRVITYLRCSDNNRALTTLECFCSAVEEYGAASIAIQVTESQVQGVMDFLLNSEILRDRRNVSYHLLFKIGPSYAINPLRALGHKFVSTPYVFYGDVDYVSSHGMYTAMKENLKG